MPPKTKTATKVAPKTITKEAPKPPQALPN